MHDAIWFEIRGIPALVIASSEFRDAAATQAEALGLIDARRLFVEHPIQDATDTEMAAKADSLIEEILVFLKGESVPSGNC